MHDFGVKFSMRQEIGKQITKEVCLFSIIANDDDDTGHLEKGGYALAKSTFDLFLQAGYPFEKNDFVVLDDTSDPDLKDLIMQDEMKDEEIESDDDENDDDEEV